MRFSQPVSIPCGVEYEGGLGEGATPAGAEREGLQGTKLADPQPSTHKDLTITIRNRSNVTTDRRLLGLGVVWLMVTLLWIAFIVGEAYMSGPTSCDLVPGRSVFGESSWSWLHLGETCTWKTELEGNPITIVQQAPAARMGVGIVLAFWGASLLVLGRREVRTAR